MKILVCISHVPDTTAKINFQSDGKSFDENGVQFIIGPYDEYALAKAVELKEKLGAEVTVLNVGLSSSESSLRKALAIGADKAVRVDAEPTSSNFVAKQIAHYAKGEAFDLILMGRETIDFSSAVLHSMVGELLDIPSISPVTKLLVESDGSVALEMEVGQGTAEIEAKLPLVLGCQEPIAEWKIAGMRGIMAARTKQIEVLPAEVYENESFLEKCEVVTKNENVKIIDEDNLDELVNFLKSDLGI